MQGIPTVLRMSYLTHSRFGGFLLQRDCPGVHGLVFAVSSRSGELYGFEPTPCSPRSHIRSTNITFGVSRHRSFDKEIMTHTNHQDSFAVRALHPRPEGRGFPHNLIKPWQRNLYLATGIRFSRELEAQGLCV